MSLATKSGGNGGGCVELRRHDGMIELRDTKDNGHGPTLRFRLDELDAFLDGPRTASSTTCCRNDPPGVGWVTGLMLRVPERARHRRCAPAPAYDARRAEVWTRGRPVLRGCRAWAPWAIRWGRHREDDSLGETSLPDELPD
ncbi:MAG: DUF397 domain-containing protein [Micromonosporaceae bacterium]